MKVKVIDDAFDPCIGSILTDYLIKLPHTLSEYSLDSSNKNINTIVESNAHLAYNFIVDYKPTQGAYTESLYFADLLIGLFDNYSFSELGSDLFSVSKLQRMHTNMHYPQVGGKTYHVDMTLCTAVWCATDHDGGGFEYIDSDGNIKFIEDKQNRMIIFQEPTMKHKAIPPKTFDRGPRLTVAAKYQRIS